MGGAILNGLLQKKVFPLENLAVFDPSQEQRDVFAKLGVQTFDDAQKGIAWSESILVGVKPQIFPFLEKLVPPKEIVPSSLNVFGSKNTVALLGSSPVLYL